MHLPHAHTLAQARTYLAALADEASNDDASSGYENVLIDLDRVHRDESPDVYLETVTQDRDIQYDTAVAAIEALKEHGVDPLTVELLLWKLEQAYAQDCS
jgi:hypothetical protein